MDMIMGPAGKPRSDLGRLMGGIVAHDDMDIEPFWDLSINLFEKLQELDCPVALVAFADDEPEATSSAANSAVVPCRTQLCVRRSGTPGIIGKTGCSRSSA